MKNLLSQKGSMGVVVIVIIVLILAGLYAVFGKSDSEMNVKKSSSATSTLTALEAEKLALDTVIDKKLTSLTKDCLKATVVGQNDATSTSVAFYEIREVHNKTCGGDPNTSPIVSVIQIDTQTGVADTIDALMDTVDSGDTSKVREFTITASNYSFTPNLITVKNGETVKINFVNSVGFHDLKIDEFKVATKKINGGSTDSVTFVANKVGSYEFYCSIGSHRAMGMKGTLVVQ